MMSENLIRDFFFVFGILAISAYPCIAQQRRSIGEAKPAVTTQWSSADLHASMVGDLSSFPKEERKFIRYLYFPHGYSRFESRSTAPHAALYARALGKILNSLSWSPTLSVPQQISPTLQQIFRIDLRAYRWTADDWEGISNLYPYRAVYGDEHAQVLRMDTGCDVPAVRGDWFVYSASRPPLYHNLLHLPDCQSQLEEALHICVTENIRTGQTWRAGFLRSGVSRSNRLVEVHKTGYGWLWLSYDFASNEGNRNIFAYPAGPACCDGDEAFRHDGGEVIFSLPNGLHAYLLVDSNGRRIDRAPIEIVSDSTSALGPVIVNGVSCMSCHQTGIKTVPDDEVLPHVEGNPAVFDDELAGVRLMHATTRLSVNQIAKASAEDYTLRLKAIGVSSDAAEPVSKVAEFYKSPVDSATLASELFLKNQDIAPKVGSSSTATKRALAAFGNGGTGQISRETVEEVFASILEEWDLGKALAPAVASTDNSVQGSTAQTDKPRTAPSGPGTTDKLRYSEPSSKVESTSQAVSAALFWRTVLGFSMITAVCAMLMIFSNRARLESAERTLPSKSPFRTL